MRCTSFLLAAFAAVVTTEAGRVVETTADVTEGTAVLQVIKFPKESEVQKMEPLQVSNRSQRSREGQASMLQKKGREHLSEKASRSLTAHGKPVSMTEHNSSVVLAASRGCRRRQCGPRRRSNPRRRQPVVAAPVSGLACQPWPEPRFSSCRNFIVQCVQKKGGNRVNCGAVADQITKCANDFCCDTACVTLAGSKKVKGDAIKKCEHADWLMKYGEFEEWFEDDWVYLPASHVCKKMDGNTGAGLLQVAAEHEAWQKGDEASMLSIELQLRAEQEAHQDTTAMEETTTSKCL